MGALALRLQRVPPSSRGGLGRGVRFGRTAEVNWGGALSNYVWGLSPRHMRCLPEESCSRCSGWEEREDRGLLGVKRPLQHLGPEYATQGPGNDKWISAAECPLLTFLGIPGVPAKLASWPASGAEKTRSEGDTDARDLLMCLLLGVWVYCTWGHERAHVLSMHV